MSDLSIADGWMASRLASFSTSPGTARLQAGTLSTAWSGTLGTARLLGKTLGTARLLGETLGSAETLTLGTARLPGETLGSAGMLGFAPDTARGTLGTAQQGALGTARLQGGTLQGALGTARLQGGTLGTARLQGTLDTARLGTLGTARLQGGTLGTARLHGGGTLGTARLQGGTLGTAQLLISSLSSPTARLQGGTLGTVQLLGSSLSSPLVLKEGPRTLEPGGRCATAGVATSPGGRGHLVLSTAGGKSDGDPVSLTKERNSGTSGGLRRPICALVAARAALRSSGSSCESSAGGA